MLEFFEFNNEEMESLQKELKEEKNELYDALSFEQQLYLDKLLQQYEKFLIGIGNISYNRGKSDCSKMLYEKLKSR